MSEGSFPTVATLPWKNDAASHKFPNGYEASVLRGGLGTYTDNGTFEIAVIYGKKIVYDTPITDNVLGYLAENEANEALVKIAALPARRRRR